MGAKSNPTGTDVAVRDPARIRNVVLVGPSGAGKTTLIEALLSAAGTIPRPGSVPEGDTVCDHDPAAVRQQRSVTVSIAPLRHDDIKINLIDTPGYVDFVGELRAGLRAADAALFVVSAAERVDTATINLWRECAGIRLPRAVVIARLDLPRADPTAELAACQAAFGAGVLPLYLPEADGLVDLLSPTAPSSPAAQRARESLIEGIIAESEDETLMDRYVAGGRLDPDMLIRDLERAVLRASFHPVIPACARTGVGLDEIRRLIIRGFPSPRQRPVPPVTSLDGGDPPALTADPDGPLAAEVIRTTVDTYVGRVSLVRVFSGTLFPDTSVRVHGHGLADRGHQDHDADERAVHPHTPLGATLTEVDACVAGDICALTKLSSAETGDTISSPENPLLMAPWPMPEPLLPIAVTARTRSDEDALARNLARLTAADPTLRTARDPETRQLVLWCMGEAHADVVLSRLRAGGTEVDTEEVRVPLRETFTAPATGHGRHVKQSGGHGQYAVCDITVEPLPRGAGFEFVDRVVGGAVPHQYIPSVEKGVRTLMSQGLDHPLVDLRVTLVDGKAHSVDSSDAAFQTAGALALKDAAATAGLAVLEPVDEIQVSCSDDHLGVVLGDLSARHGRVLGTEPHGDGTTTIRAEVPAANLVRYTVELRALTSGTATFTRHFARYEPTHS